MSASYSKTRILLECAVMIALATVLGMIKLFQMPLGGSVTVVSMLPVMVISFRHGVKWGLLTGFVHSLLQMLLEGLYPPPAGTVLSLVLEVLLDYVLAFTVLGLAGVLGRDGKLSQVIGGGVLAMGLRFLCSFLSGFIIWASIAEEGVGAVLFSLGYNAQYMVPEIILTTVVAVILNRLYPPLFRRQDARPAGQA